MSSAANDQPLLRAVDVNVTVDEQNLLARSVSLALQPGDVLSLSGPSGSGKSTLLRALAMLEPRAAGTVELRGQIAKGSAVPAFRRQVVYVAQRAPRFPMLVLESLRQPFLFRAATTEFDRERAQSLCQSLLLPDDVLERELRDLSGGEAQRVAMVRALLIEPTVLLLDEPTSALDADARAEVGTALKAWLESGDRAAIVASHDEALAGLANRKLSLAGEAAA